MQVIKPSQGTVNKFLKQMSSFKAENVLADAIRTFIASQLLANRETREAESVFVALDLNGDGRLSKEDLVVAYSTLFGEHSEGVVEEVMTQIDTDNNGYIDYTEFLRVTTDTSKLLSERNLRSAFSLFDKDGNGKISATEIKDMLSGGMYSSDDIWRDLIEEVDQNGDGEIDMDELKGIILSKI